MGRRIRRRAERTDDDREWFERVAKAIQDGTDLDSLPDRPKAPRSAAGDPGRLRGIPMIGGASGAIPGTSPHHQKRLERWSGAGGRA